MTSSILLLWLVLFLSRWAQQRADSRNETTIYEYTMMQEKQPLSNTVDPGAVSKHKL